MHTLILYMSKHGTTEKTVTLLAEKLKDSSIKIVNLQKDGPPNINDFDNVIIGGSIHAGTMQSKLRKYVENNLPDLLSKKTGLFMCCMERNEKQEEQFNNAYPMQLRETASCKAYFGGEFKFSRMNFIEKAIIKKISGIDHDFSDIDIDAISEFANDWNKRSELN